MEEERRSMESKLQDRLKKKRQAKEEEIQRASLSEQVKQCAACVSSHQCLN